MCNVGVGVCREKVATALPLRKLSDLGYAHVFLEMFKHVDDSLQQVGNVTILPLSGHSSKTKQKLKNKLEHIY